MVNSLEVDLRRKTAILSLLEGRARAALTDMTNVDAVMMPVHKTIADGYSVFSDLYRLDHSSLNGITLTVMKSSMEDFVRAALKVIPLFQVGGWFIEISLVSVVMNDSESLTCFVICLTAGPRSSPGGT